jgi:hypothetical protein
MVASAARERERRRRTRFTSPAGRLDLQSAQSESIRVICDGRCRLADWPCRGRAQGQSLPPRLALQGHRQGQPADRDWTETGPAEPAGSVFGRCRACPVGRRATPQAREARGSRGALKTPSRAEPRGAP